MTRRLWGWLGAAFAGAALVMSSAPAHAGYGKPEGPGTGSAPLVKPPAVKTEPADARGAYFTVWAGGVNVRVNRADMNACHRFPTKASCPDSIASVPANARIYVHCQVAGEVVKGNANWVYMTWNDRTGYLAGRYVQKVGSLPGIVQCRF